MVSRAAKALKIYEMFWCFVILWCCFRAKRKANFWFHRCAETSSSSLVTSNSCLTIRLKSKSHFVLWCELRSCDSEFWEKLNMIRKFLQFFFAIRWKLFHFMMNYFIFLTLLNFSRNSREELIKICFMPAKGKSVACFSHTKICIIFILFHFPFCMMCFHWSEELYRSDSLTNYKLHSSRCNCWWI